MKKNILMLVFAIAVGSMSLNASVNTFNSVEGDASDCVRSARSATEALADRYGWDIHNGGSESEFAVEVFMTIYLDCYNN